MIDKVQKIRNEVERLQNELIQERKKGYGSDVDDACILELQNVLTYIDSLQEEPVSDGLEEESKKNSSCIYLEEILSDDDKEVLINTFKAGAELQKQQMMKEAINGYVIEDIEEGNGDFLLSCEYLPKNMGLVDQQKVKVIVIKGD